MSYDGHPVPGSPFQFEAQLPPDPSKVQITEPWHASLVLYGAKIFWSSDWQLHLSVFLVPQVKVAGQGLSGGLVGNPAEFSIDTTGAGTGSLGLTVEGPTEAKIECSDNGDGTCSVSYMPTEPGEYLVNVLFQEVHVPGSPFRAHIQRPLDPSKVLASGAGLIRAKVGPDTSVSDQCSFCQDKDEMRYICQRPFL